MPKGIAKNGKRRPSPRVERVVRVCEVCGKERLYLPGEVYQREVRGGQSIRFCSRGCDSLGRSVPGTRIELTCDVCGKLFKKRADHLHVNNFCSKSCSGQARRVEGARWRDPKQIREYMIQYEQKNRERINQGHYRWNRANPEKRQAIAQARRTKESSHVFTAKEWREMKHFYDYRCLCCGKQEPEIKLEADHVVPLSRDGIHRASNIQPLCRYCNASKGAKTIDYRQVRAFPDTEVS